MPETVAIEGGIGDVYEYFLERGWTDGLPVVAPTEAAVEPTDAAEDTTVDTAGETPAEDPDAGPASEPGPAQPDQAEGEDSPDETS